MPWLFTKCLQNSPLLPLKILLFVVLLCALLFCETPSRFNGVNGILEAIVKADTAAQTVNAHADDIEPCVPRR